MQHRRIAKEERTQLCDRALDYFSEVDRPVPSNELVSVLFPRERLENGHGTRLVREVLRRDTRFQEPRNGTWDLIGARFHHLDLADARFCVVDLEATGSNPRRDQVIEVGIVVIEGLRITRRYSSLVNPGQRIPVWIRKLTGIDDSVVTTEAASGGRDRRRPALFTQTSLLCIGYGRDGESALPEGIESAN